MLKRRISVITTFILLWSMLASVLPVTTYAADSSNTALIPYFNASLPVETRVADLLGRMTMDEKIGQMVQAERASVTPADVKNYSLGSVLSGGGSFPNGKQADSTRANWADLVDSYQAGALSTKLGIPILYGVDAIHGQSNLIGATLFPHNIGLGATRDASLVTQIGTATAQEIKASGTNWAFAPTVADPQNINWGRTYEGFGDDQALVAQMGAAYVKGLQGTTIGQLKNSDKVVATVKHFLGEGLTENGINQGNITGMSEQEVLNLDLPIYKAAVDAGARTVMASYNSINGLKMHANQRLLTDVLKGTGEGQLGFTGFVISDYNAVQQITKDWNNVAVSGLKDQIRVAVNAGVDMMMMPDSWKTTLTNLQQLVDEGKITQERINDAVTRILRVKFESGVFEHPMTDKSLEATFGSASHRELARKAVRESLVLLKNDKVNGATILSQLKGMSKIFVAGKSADNIGLQSGGWSITWQGLVGNTTQGTTILQGIKNSVGGSKAVTYNEHGRGAAGNDVAIAVIGEKPYAEGAGDSLNSLKLDQEDIATLKNIRESGVPTIVVLVSGRPLMVNDQIGDWAGLVEAWLPGTEGQGVADVLFGDYDFTGKLPVRWPFYTEAYKNPAAGTSNLDPKYILFDYGYGLNKTQVTPGLLPTPEQPGLEAYVKVQAESFTEQQGIQLENTGDTGGGQNLGYTDAGDWMDYLINVPQAGTFDIDFRHAGQSTDNTGFDIYEVAAGNVGAKIGEVFINHTGGWQSWQTTTTHGVTLKAGVQKIRLVLKDGGVNFNWFGSKGFSPAAPQPAAAGTVTPQTAIQASVVENWVSTERDSKDLRWYYGPRWETSDKQLEQQGNLDLTEVGPAVEANVTTININPGKEYQSMMGIGTSMEESTVNNLVKMSPAKQDELLKKLVSKTDGIGMSMMRVTIGSADFTAQKFYTYDDMPKGETDESLSHFSIQKDIDYGIITALQKMKAINPDIKFFASPWSPPGWMKSTDSMIRGQVIDKYLPALADYYVKFIQAYNDQGINIEAMTLQNEPLLEIDYPSTKMTWQQEAELAKLLKQKLIAANLDVKLWIFDHNPGDTMSYPAPMLAVPENSAAIDGTAFHDYGGDLNLMTQLHDMFPDKNTYLTERAVWGTEGADRIAQYFRNWAKSYNSWVGMLDSDINTHQWIGTPDPTMLVQDSSNRDNYWMTPEYYFTGQFSKFVEPDYIRIDSNYGSADKVTNVSFMSPDKTKIVTVVINQTASPQTFKLVSDGTQIAATLPAKSVATYRWNRLSTEIVEPAKLHVNQETLDYNVDSQEITLNLSGGKFKDTNVSDINLTGEATSKGVTVSSVTYVTYTEVKVKLAWNNTPYYGDLKLSVNVPVTSYFNSTSSEPLRVDLKLKGTVTETAATLVPGTVTSAVYHQLSGVTAEIGKLTGIGAGDWVDFKINVEKAGKYNFMVNAAAPNSGGSTFQLKSKSTNETLTTFNIPSGPNGYNGIRASADLEAGEQIIRILGSVGTFDMRDISIKEVISQTADVNGILKVEAEDFVEANHIVIQYGDPITNLGYSIAGTYMDYLVTLPKTSNYKVKYHYATPQGNVSASLQVGGQTKGETSLPSTGGWGNYNEATSIIHLDAGEQMIRLLDNGDGFNLDWIQLEPTTDSTPALIVKAAAPLITVRDGQIGNEQIVTLATSIADANIYYTTDGTLPTVDSTLYMEAITITTSKVIRAIVVKAGMDDSFISFYAIAAASPKANPSSGTYNHGINVTLTSNTVGAAVYYTTDGRVPTTTSSLYSGPISLSTNTTLRAITIKDGMNHSDIGEFIYNFTNPGTDPGTNPGTDPGTNPGTDPGTNPGTDPGTNPGTDPGTNPGTDPGTNPGTNPGTTQQPTASPIATATPKPAEEGKFDILTDTPIVDPITKIATVIINDNAIKQALEKVAKNEDGTQLITIRVPKVLGASAYEVKLTAKNLITDGTNYYLEIVTELGTMKLPSNMLRSANLAGAEIVELSISDSDMSKLSPTLQAQIGNKPVLDLNVKVDGVTIAWNNPNAPVIVSIPYSPTSEELLNLEHLTIWYINENAEINAVPSGKYDAQLGDVRFQTTHFSKYAVAFVNKTFKDLTDFSWAKTAIEVMASKGVIKGSSSATFTPNASIKRADFLQLLVKALSLNATVDSNFMDVDPSKYYYESVGISKKLGIAQGKDGNRFDPEAVITRQEMITLAARAMEIAKKKLVTGTESDLKGFADKSAVASYALESVATLIKNGIIKGDGTSVQPLKNTTRAEAAVMIYRIYNQ